MALLQNTGITTTLEIMGPLKCVKHDAHVVEHGDVVVVVAGTDTNVTVADTPENVTLKSLVKTTVSTLCDAVTADGCCAVPLSAWSSGELVVGPSYTSNTSYPASVEKAL